MYKSTPLLKLDNETGGEVRAVCKKSMCHCDFGVFANYGSHLRESYSAENDRLTTVSPNGKGCCHEYAANKYTAYQPPRAISGSQPTWNLLSALAESEFMQSHIVCYRIRVGVDPRKNTITHSCPPYVRSQECLLESLYSSGDFLPLYRFNLQDATLVSV